MEVAIGAVGVAGDGGWRQHGDEVVACPRGSLADSMAAGDGDGGGGGSLVPDTGAGGGGGGYEAVLGLLDSEKTKFLSLQTFSAGKIKKISKKEFTEMFQKGEYYPPEGATVFCEQNSDTFYVYGGARASKPGHWGMSNHLFKIRTSRLEPMSDNHASEIVSFDMFNHTVSKTSSFCKLYAASGLTEVASDSKLLAFIINGKNLDCPSEARFVTNEIQILETVSDTTFRSTILRSGKDSQVIDNLKSREVFQLGDIPAPSYGACLVRVPTMDRGDIRVAVKTGGAVLANQNFSDLDVLFSNSPLWEEMSSNEVHILRYNISQKIFSWQKIDVPDLPPLAFHSAIVMGHYMFVFGGLNIKTKQRYSISPLKIDLEDWTLTHVRVEGLPHGYLAGAGLAAGPNHAYIVGGYQQQIADDSDRPCDRMIQVTFHKGKVT